MLTPNVGIAQALAAIKDESPAPELQDAATINIPNKLVLDEISISQDIIREITRVYGSYVPPQNTRILWALQILGLS